MSSTQYILKNNLLADLSYFSESRQEDRQVRIVLNSVTYNHDKKHYVFDYWEDSMAKHIRALKVKSLTIYGFADFKKVQRTIQREDIFDFIDELKLVSKKVYQPGKDDKIDFSQNWVKDKSIVVVGSLLDVNKKPLNIHKEIHPVIEKLGGHPKGQIGFNTNVLIAFGDCSHNGSYKYAQSNGIPIANLVEFMDLVQGEFNKPLAEVIDESFLVFM